MQNELRVSRVSPADRSSWESFVQALGDDAGYHAWDWQQVFEDVFGHQPVYLIARRGAALAGVFPWVQIKSLMFGNPLTSLPFLNYGGVPTNAPQAATA